jgi:histidinol-phosphate aminotransferase
MFDPEKIVRDNVRSLTPYSCARDEYQGSEGIFLDANENPFGTLNRYPDPYQAKLKAEISRIRDVPVEKIFLGNGSDEIIDLCFRVFCKPGTDKALTFSPTYGMYEVSASVNDVSIIKIPLNKEFQPDYNDVKPFFSDKNLKLILICSPNNPTGNCMNRAVVEEIVTSFKGVVLIDEAYIDFAGEASMKESLGRFPNLIVMQTFSKAFGMASVRVGMAFTSPAIIRYFNKMKPPYNISTINQKAVLRRIRRISIYENQVRQIKEDRASLSSELQKLPVVVKVFSSDANFLLVKVINANNIYNYLINKGIIVRNRSSILENCLRITVGTRSENNKLLKALKSFES